MYLAEQKPDSCFSLHFWQSREIIYDSIILSKSRVEDHQHTVDTHFKTPQQFHIFVNSMGGMFSPMAILGKKDHKYFKTKPIKLSFGIKSC